MSKEDTVDRGSSLLTPYLTHFMTGARSRRGHTAAATPSASAASASASSSAMHRPPRRRDRMPPSAYLGTLLFLLLLLAFWHVRSSQQLPPDTAPKGPSGKELKAALEVCARDGAATR